jgi:hypothetical protein
MPQHHADRTYAVTGAASGIGAATTAYLRAAGARVIACDLRDTEVEADLANAAGRATLVEGVTRLCGGWLDGIVATPGAGRPRPCWRSTSSARPRPWKACGRCWRGVGPRGPWRFPRSARWGPLTRHWSRRARGARRPRRTRPPGRRSPAAREHSAAREAGPRARASPRGDQAPPSFPLPRSSHRVGHHDVRGCCKLRTFRVESLPLSRSPDGLVLRGRFVFSKHSKGVE